MVRIVSNELFKTVVTVDFLDEDDEYDMGWDDIGQIGDHPQIIGGNGNDVVSFEISV